MVTKTSQFQFDWWVVQKRAVHATALVLVLGLVASGAALYVWKFGNPLKRVALKTDLPAGARFESFEGDVRVIHAATREVVLASSDTQLYPGDTVQTQADGRARIAMADGSTVVVRPNSTIIIRDNESSEGGKRSNVHVVVDSGQMLVRTQEQNEGAKNVVETPKTQNQVGAQTQASFGVNPEGTEEIRVNAGSIESQNRSGERTTLNSGEYVSVNQSGTISKPQRLLEVPQPAQPRDLEKIIVGNNGSASVALRWLKPQTGAPVYYRVEVATSPFFVLEGKVIERDQLISTQFSATDLRPGAYFWRVRATAATGQTSDWSEPQKFIVATPSNGSGSVVVTRLSASYLGGDLYIIRGSGAPGTTISVSGREALVGSDGSFQVQITANSTMREVTIMAFDPQGNRSQYRLPLTRNG
ncbi:MAG TPA: FecR domain-containing protein [Pyrinomonadaceae bacterium]|jgi:ferric-dicitrate binding protein FerR (iron transport regulator)